MRIDETVLRVLSRSSCEGERLTLPEQLDRKLYVQTNKVLEGLGAMWSRKAKAHLFPCPAADALESVLLTGSIVLPADFGFFPTPAAVVDELIGAADVDARHLVLEPSAGEGAIAIPLDDRVGAKVTCCEIQHKHVVTLEAAGLTVHEGDFLEVLPDCIFDRVVMNPPFARRADILHVTHAGRFVKPGGRLVAVMSAGIEFRDDRLANEFREMVARQDGEIRKLPANSFASSTTGVSTVLVTINF